MSSQPSESSTVAILASALTMTSETTVEVIYFDGPGRANLTRLALVAGDVSFKDTRVADWPAMKADPSSVPGQLFGSLPCLKHGSLILAQSIALAVYAADLGLYNKAGDSVDAATRAVDVMVVTTNEELKQLMYKCLFGDDESKAAGKKALPEPAALKLGALERALERKTSDGPFFSSTLGLADLAVFDSINSPFPGLRALEVDLTPYPKLVACADAVGQNEKIKAFVDQGWKIV